MAEHRSKQEILRLMHRLGMHEEATRAQAELPEVIDLDSEQHRRLLQRVGLEPNVEKIRDRLGGSP
jgi:hypothetical protein